MIERVLDLAKRALIFHPDHDFEAIKREVMSLEWSWRPKRELIDKLLDIFNKHAN